MTKREWFLLGVVFVAAFAAIVWMARDQILVREELQSVHKELDALNRAYVRLDGRIAGLEKAAEEPLSEMSGMYLIVLRDSVLGPVGIVPFNLPAEDEPLASGKEETSVCGCADGEQSCTSL